MKSRAFLCLVAAVIWGLSASASARAGDDPSGDRTMRVISFGGSADGLFYKNGPAKAELVTSPGALSYDLPMPKDAVLQLFRELPPADSAAPDAKPRVLPAGTVELVPGARKAIIVLIVPPDLSKAPIRGRAFKDSYNLHPAGTIRVFNLSPKEIAMRIGGEAKQFAIGDSGVMQWKNGDAEAVPYQVGTRDTATDRWEIVENGERASRPNLRVFAFVSEIIVEGVPTVAARMAFDDVPEE